MLHNHILQCVLDHSVVYSLSKILQFMVSFVKSDVNSLVGWLY